MSGILGSLDESEVQRVLDSLPDDIDNREIFQQWFQESNARYEETERARQEERSLREEADRAREEANREREEESFRRREADRAREEADRAREKADNERKEERLRRKKADREREEERFRRREADRAREAADRARNKEKLLREAAELKTRKTTFFEFLTYCHDNFSAPLTVQCDKTKSTQGEIGQQYDKVHPVHLKKWSGFANLMNHRFREVWNFFDSDSDTPLRVFPQLSTVEDAGKMVCRSPIGSEQDLSTHQYVAVSYRVIQVLNELNNIKSAREAYGPFLGVEFSGHPNILGEGIVEAQNSPAPTRLDKSEQVYKRPDQYCSYSNPGDRNSLLYVIEYKPPHKLEVNTIREGLKALTANPIRQEVLHYKKPQEEKAKAKFYAKKKTLRAVVQTYDYMIRHGLPYSSLSTGQTIVFFRIQPEDPGTLEYYQFIPPLPRHQARDPKKRVCSTMVGQAVAFTLLASKTERFDQDWRKEWLAELDTTLGVGESVMPNTPDNPRTRRRARPSSVYEPSPEKVVDEQPSKPRRDMISFRSRQSCRGAYTGDGQSKEDDDGNDNDDRNPQRKFGRGARSTKNSRSASSNEKGKDSSTSTSSNHWTQRSGLHCSGFQSQGYCTQKCLLGLIEGSLLDEMCPNVEGHRSGNPRRKTHAVDSIAFTKMVREQLDRSLDNDILCLWKEGARGLLFKIVLASYGYTFVAKGTVACLASFLQHEGAVYRQLARLQGKKIPVYLGNIDMVWPWRDHGLEIIHMLLMSWAGCSELKTVLADPKHPQFGKTDSRKESTDLAALLLEEGVVHDDIGDRHVLWNEELDCGLLIDFDRSIIMTPTKAIQPSVESKANTSNSAKPLTSRPTHKTTKQSKKSARSPLGELPNSLAKNDTPPAGGKNHQKIILAETSGSRKRKRNLISEETDCTSRPWRRMRSSYAIAQT